MTRKMYWRTPLLVIVLLFSNSALAEDSHWYDRLELRGFLTQGYVATSHNNWFGDSTDGSLAFTEAGINGYLQLHPRLRLAAQGLSRRAGKMDNGTPRLDYGMLDHSILYQQDFQLGMRFGRVKNEVGLYNSTRDVAATRPGVFMPQSIYFGRVRNLLLSTDGGSLYASWHNDFGSFYVDANVGLLSMDDSVESTFYALDLPGDVVNDGLNSFTRLLFDSIDGRIRLAVSHADFSISYKPGERDPFTAGSIQGTFWIGSAEYNSENWSVTAEYGQLPIDYTGTAPVFEKLSGVVETYYLQYTHRFDSRWSSWLRFEQTFLDKDDRNGRQRSLFTGRPDYVSYSRAWVAGLRWDINSSWLLSAEYQRQKGGSYLSRQDNISLNTTSKHWDIFSLLVSYRF